MASRPLVALLLVCLGHGQVARGGDCQHFAVTSADGYANVRSTPRVESGNVVAVLPTGTPIESAGRRRGWLRMKSPLAGWIARSQVSGFPCGSAARVSSNAGLAAIDRLGGRGQAGDEPAAATFLMMSRWVDGSLAEAYAGAIADWAVRDADSLISLLERQSEAVREAALKLLDFGLGSEAPGERRRFEAVVARLPSGSAVARDWRRTRPGGE